MSISRILREELYKLTEEYKKETANSSLIRRYIFKPKGQENEEPSGSLSFIDSDKLYDFDDEIFASIDNDEEQEEYKKNHPDIRTYFKYNSIAGRFLKKDLKVANLPVDILKRIECPICSLSREADYFEGYRDNNGNPVINQYSSDGKFPLNIFGKVYNANDFLKYTGVLISVYSVIKNKNNRYETYKLSTANVKVTILSSNYFDISFTDSNPNFSYYIVEVCKVCNTAQDSNLTDSYAVKFAPNEKYEYYKSYKDSGNSDSSDIIYYKSKYFKPVNVDTVTYDNKQKQYEINLLDDDFKGRYVDASQFIIWLFYSDGKSMMIPTSTYNGFEVNQSYAKLTIKLPDDLNDNNLKFDAYCIYDKEQSKMPEPTINDILSEYGIDEYVEAPMRDDENYDEKLIDYFPEYLRSKLEDQATTYFGKKEYIDLEKDVIKYINKEGQYTPCLRFEIPLKHSSFMIFNKGELMPPYKYFEGHHTITVLSNSKETEESIGISGNMYIYIDISELGYRDAIYNNRKSIELDSPIYIVASTDSYFNENVVYSLTAVNKYVLIDDVKRYARIDLEYMNGKYDQSKVITGSDSWLYVEDSNGVYVEYFGDIFKLKSDDKFTIQYVKQNDSDYYKKVYVKDSNGEYYEVISNEYVLPVNKRLTPEKISIMVEQMLNVNDVESITRDDGTKFEYSKATTDDVDNGYNIYYSISKDNWVTKAFVPEQQIEIIDGENVIIKEDGSGNRIVYKVKSSDIDNSPIKYVKVRYKHSLLLNNLKFLKDSGDTGLYIKDEFDRYIKTQPETIKEFRKFNDILKIRLSPSGEIIDCGYPDTDEYLHLIDCNYIDQSPADDVDDESGEPINIIDFNSSTVGAVDGIIVAGDGVNNQTLYAYDNSNGFSKYFMNDANDEFLSYPIPNQLIASDNKLLAFMNGRLTDEFIIDKHLYYRLFDGDTMLAFSDDPIVNQDMEDVTEYKKFKYNKDGDYVFDPIINKYRKDNGSESDKSLHHYKKIIATVYITNPGNYTLYQDIHGLEYDDETGIFTISNSIDGVVIDAQKMYGDNYMIPFSTKYMMVFVNGYYIPSDYIKVISNRRFGFIGLDEYLGCDKLEINEMYIYRYDYINPDKYIDYFDSKSTKVRECVVHPIYDNLWDKYLGKEEYSDKVSDGLYKNIEINARDLGFNSSNTNTAMYEIFGKYVLNKYDIDSDFELSGEIRSYFDSLYDRDGRMRLELILDEIKRKYVY